MLRGVAYFSTFLVVASYMNWSLQYVNLISCDIEFGFGVGGFLVVTPSLVFQGADNSM